MFAVFILLTESKPPPIPLLLTLRSRIKNEEFLPASQDVYIGCVRTMAVSQKKVQIFLLCFVQFSEINFVFFLNGASKTLTASFSLSVNHVNVVKCFHSHSNFICIEILINMHSLLFPKILKIRYRLFCHTIQYRLL